MKNYTETVLDAISKALNAGRYDVMTVLLVVIAIILFFVVLSSVLKFTNRKKTRESSEASYQHLIRKYNLTILEVDLILELAETLKNPKKKYQLLIDKTSLRIAVQKLGDLPEEKLLLLNSIKKKTGLAAETEHKDSLSTKSFSRGMPVYLELQSREICHAEIYSISDSDLTIKISDKKNAVKDEAVRLYSFSSPGINTYSLKIIKSKEGLISTHHAQLSEPDKKALKLEVNFIYEGDDNIQTHRSVVHQLVNKGAVLDNPTDILQAGDKIKISPVNDMKNLFQVSAEVDKVSTVKKLVFIKFTC
jgi:hypothetical protein